MVKALTLAVVAAVFATSCFAQSCIKPKPFISDAFDLIRSSFETGYHDLDFGRSLFVDKEDSDLWILYDLVKGAVYWKDVDSKACYFYANDDMKFVGAANMTIDFQNSDFLNFNGVGYSIVQNDVLIRGVGGLGGCVELVTYMTKGGKPYANIIRDNVRLHSSESDVNSEIRTNVDPVIAYIEAGNCAEADSLF